MRLIIDSHLDLSWNALSWNRDLTESVELIRQRERGMSDKRGRARGTVALPDMRRGGIAVCLGTLLVRAQRVSNPNGPMRTDLDFPTQDIASAIAHGQLAYYRELNRRGEIRILRTNDDLSSH